MLEQKTDSPSYCFDWKSSEREERLERVSARPRQVRGFGSDLPPGVVDFTVQEGLMLAGLPALNDRS